MLSHIVEAAGLIVLVFIAITCLSFLASWLDEKRDERELEKAAKEFCEKIEREEGKEK